MAEIENSFNPKGVMSDAEVRKQNLERNNCRVF